MTLYTQQVGDGSPLVLLHGWALHSGVWDPVLSTLQRYYRCITIDLPGHGKSPVVDGGLDEWAGACLAVAPRNAIWLGWSLGGMVAQAAAIKSPSTFAGLLLVATTARLLRAPDWPHGIAPETMAQTARQLETDWRATIDDFLVLQTMAAAGGKTALNMLRAAIVTANAPTPEGLSAGLRILETIDLRAQLGAITAPVHVMSGALDRLTTPGAGRALAAALDTDYTEVAHAAHTPFLSHPDQFTDWVMTHGR